MADVAQPAQHDFWRPPMPASQEASGPNEVAGACERCGTEFIVGSRFCHTCGTGRPDLAAASRLHERITIFPLGGLSVRLGLSTAPLIAFFVGVLCLAAALGVGVIFSARTVLDWQAVQLWRIEWLLAAVAAFAAGCLLKQAR